MLGWPYWAGGDSQKRGSSLAPGEGNRKNQSEPSLPRWKEPGIHARDVFSEGFYDIYEGVLEMKRRNLERFWVLQLRFKFNEDPSVAHRTFNTASIVFEVALSNGHMLSEEMTV